MKNLKKNRAAPVFYTAALSAVIVIALTVSLTGLSRVFTSGRITYNLMPWQSVGGCGAGGSGGGTSDGITWIGKSLSQGIVDIEMLPRYNFGRNFSSFSFSPRITYKVNWTNSISLNVPLVSKEGDVQLQTNMEPSYHKTGGFGDISLDYSRSFGSSGQFSMFFGLSLPTGKYDIKRGRDSESYFLPKDLQKGAGIYSLSGKLFYSRDIEDGILIFNIEYNFPFNISASKENRFLDEYFSDYSVLKNDKRFYYYFKPYGENDLGDVTPMSCGLNASYGYSGIEGQMHSVTVTVSAPLSRSYINQINLVNNDGDYSGSVYKKAVIDPDFMSWSSAFVYGVELSRGHIPIFLAVSLPLHSKTYKDDSSRFTGPDWEDFGQQWTFALGFRTFLFQ